MGKLWQKTDNTVFNAPLLALKEKVLAGTATPAEFAEGIKQARATADMQSLERTELQLRQFEKAPLTAEDLADETKRVNIAKQIDRVMRNAQVRVVDQKTVKITRPTLVYLSGFLTNNDRNDYVLGSIKRVEELFRGRPEVKEQPDVYGWTHTDLKNLFNLAVYDTFPNSRSSGAGYDLATCILMPLVAKDFGRDEKGQVKGTPLPLDEARKNLKNVTFFGYSAGSIVAQETFNATRKMMKKIGYSEEDVRDLMKEVVLIAVGTISRPSKERDRYTTVNLVASNDRIMRAKNWIWGTLGSTFKKLKQILTLKGWNKNDRELSIRPLSDNYLFITGAARKSLYEWNYDGDGNRLSKRPFDPLIPEWTLIRSYHEIPHYTTMDEKNNGFARIAHYACVNAFNRQGRITVKELLQPTTDDTHPMEKQQEYRTRIAEAMRDMPKLMRM